MEPRACPSATGSSTSATCGTSRACALHAVALFYASEGYLPTQLELEHFGRFRGFAREGRKKRSWPQCLELGLVRIRALALPAPPEYGTRPEEGTWMPIELDLGELPTALSSEPYPHVAVVEKVREFALGLRGRSATDWRWRSFARGRPDVPSLKVIKAHGGLDALIEEAARPDWRERAEVWVDPRHKTPDQEAAEASARLQSRAHKPDAQAVYEVIRAGDGVSAAEIAEALSWKLDRVRSWLRVLKGAERIAPTNTFAQAKNQTYRIVDEQQSDIEREAA
jgi:predicted transcriptional regulator